MLHYQPSNEVYWYKYELYGNQMKEGHRDSRLSEYSKNLMYLLRAKDPSRVLHGSRHSKIPASAKFPAQEGSAPANPAALLFLFDSFAQQLCVDAPAGTALAIPVAELPLSRGSPYSKAQQCSSPTECSKEEQKQAYAHGTEQQQQQQQVPSFKGCPHFQQTHQASRLQLASTSIVVHRQAHALVKPANPAKEGRGKRTALLPEQLASHFEAWSPQPLTEAPQARAVHAVVRLMRSESCKAATLCLRTMPEPSTHPSLKPIPKRMIWPVPAWLLHIWVLSTFKRIVMISCKDACDLQEMEGHELEQTLDQGGPLSAYACRVRMSDVHLDPATGRERGTGRGRDTLIKCLHQSCAMSCAVQHVDPVHSLECPSTEV
eukprot:scaffold36469_cov21-Tisochrysis_lutea.AAC.1